MIKNKKQEGVYLPPEIQLTLFSFFTKKELCLAGEISKTYNQAAKEAWEVILKNELDYHYDKSTQEQPKIVYDRLNGEFNKERELFIQIIQCHNYFQYYTELDDRWEYFHGISFSDSIKIKGYHLFHLEIYRCQLTDTSLDSLLLEINQFNRQILSIINRWHVENEMWGTIPNKGKLLFRQFYDNPRTLTSGGIKTLFTTACFH